MRLPMFPNGDKVFGFCWHTIIFIPLLIYEPLKNVVNGPRPIGSISRLFLH